MGFRSVSFRLVKDFNLETGRELTPTESSKLPQYRSITRVIKPCKLQVEASLSVN
jgi:hypothetical protein